MQQRLGSLVQQLQKQTSYLKNMRVQPVWHSNVATIFDTLRHQARIHQSLVVLTLFILINNIVVAQAAIQVPTLPTDIIVSDPYEIADTVRLLSAYTSGIDEDPDLIAHTLEERVNGSFLSTNPLIATQPSLTNEPHPQSTTSQNGSDERKKEIKYTVQIGDTLSGIGSKFDLKLATIKITNNLNDVDSLKPGQELVIPVDDLSEKAVKAAQDRQKASKELADKRKETAKKIIAGIKSGGYGLTIPIRHNGISRGLIAGVHTGIDYRASIGTPITAASDGVVVVADESGWNGGYGKTVLLAHGGNKTTRYGHMNDVSVRQGQHVSQGEVIGYSGNTGRSTGPHLHFELRVNGKAVNPF